MVLEVALVMVLRAPEPLERSQLGHDRIVIEVAAGQVVHEASHRLALRLVAVVDRGTVLRADIVTLAVQGRGIVHGEEDREDVLEPDAIAVEGHLDHFGMAGLAAADGLVGGIRDLAAGIAGLDPCHPFDLQVDRLCAPEAATPQGDHFEIRIGCALHDVPVAGWAIGQDTAGRTGPPWRGTQAGRHCPVESTGRATDRSCGGGSNSRGRESWQLRPARRPASTGRTRCGSMTSSARTSAWCAMRPVSTARASWPRAYWSRFATRPWTPPSSARWESSGCSGPPFRKPMAVRD